MKPWDLKQIIKERVNKEAEIEHANDPKPETPNYQQEFIILSDRYYLIYT